MLCNGHFIHIYEKIFFDKLFSHADEISAVLFDFAQFYLIEEKLLHHGKTYLKSFKNLVVESEIYFVKRNCKQNRHFIIL